VQPFNNTKLVSLQNEPLPSISQVKPATLGRSFRDISFLGDQSNRATAGTGQVGRDARLDLLAERHHEILAGRKVVVEVHGEFVVATVTTLLDSERNEAHGEFIVAAVSTLFDADGSNNGQVKSLVTLDGRVVDGTGDGNLEGRVDAGHGVSTLPVDIIVGRDESISNDLNVVGRGLLEDTVQNHMRLDGSEVVSVLDSRFLTAKVGKLVGVSDSGERGKSGCKEEELHGHGDVVESRR
jgi:hypothetical protein